VPVIQSLTKLRRPWWARTTTYLAQALRVLPCFCPVCGRLGAAVVRASNLRESSVCVWCRSASRQRQMAVVVLAGLPNGTRPRSLAALAGAGGLSVFNAESRGSVHAALSSMAGYRSSEYFGPEYSPGQRVDGVEHQDLQNLGLEDESFDLVLTSDVLEHVPDPYAAHAEIRRILRPGGRHVFTIPFDPTLADDRQRARLEPDGTVVHHLPAEYHGDPLREGGALVFTDFGRGALDRIRALGFGVSVHLVTAPWYGIYDGEPLVFVGVRTQS
jgi:SAM-dependent methyltransferase